MIYILNMSGTTDEAPSGCRVYKMEWPRARDYRRRLTGLSRSHMNYMRLRGFLIFIENEKNEK